MKDLLQKFENKSPEIVFHWRDAETEAEGWTAAQRGPPSQGARTMSRDADADFLTPCAGPGTTFSCGVDGRAAAALAGAAVAQAEAHAAEARPLER
jgi:hypothetical protein